MRLILTAVFCVTLAAPARACLPGWDCCKWNNSRHPKYVVGRILISYPPTPAGLKAALPEISAVYPGTSILPGRGGKTRFPCIGAVDLLLAAGPRGASWWWKVDEPYGECVQCGSSCHEDISRPARCGAVRPPGEPPHMSSHPTERGFVYDLNSHRYLPRPRAPAYSATRGQLLHWCSVVDPEGCAAGRRYGQTRAEQDATSERLARGAGIAFNRCRLYADGRCPDQSPDRASQQAPSPAAPFDGGGGRGGGGSGGGRGPSPSGSSDGGSIGVRDDRGADAIADPGEPQAPETEEETQ